MCDSDCGERPNNPLRQPIINSPYEAPCWHYRVDRQGVAILGDANPGRRPSEAYVSPVPLPTGQQPLLLRNQSRVLRGTEDPLASMAHVNDLRERVNAWRREGYPGTTDITRTLLRYWEDPERSRRLYFAQLEAVRTLIYLIEAVTDDDMNLFIESVNAEYNDNMPRIAVKMATGVGKTVVMAMTALWQAANHWEYPADERFTNRFVAVTPGITVRDRLLSGLRADSVDQNDVYLEMDLLPPVGEYRKRINSAQIEVMNFHKFIPRKADMMRVSAVGKAVSGYEDKRESEAEALTRALGDLLEYGGAPVMVLNDEGHHCHKGGGKDREGREAIIWYSGIQVLHKSSRLHSVVDFSATPSFISGGSKLKGKLFPWVASDYSIVDAIEAGIVKIPRAPVFDNLSPEEMPIYRDIYNQTDDIKRGFSEDRINSDLESALRTMYTDYERESESWSNSRRDSKVPSLIISVNSIANANGLYRYIAGYPSEVKEMFVPGRLGDLLSNYDANGRSYSEPRTILMHDGIESSEGELTTLGRPISVLADLYRSRFPNAVLSEDRRDKRRLSEGDNKEVLRRVLNTVGKPGEPGGRVRCVVSVRVISEGWDARTVTHMVGFRAFSSQLLCEQIGGRTLRRRIYEVDEETQRFPPEYSTVVGVPWSYVPPGGPNDVEPVCDVRPAYTVGIVPGRARHRVRWPNVIGYEAFGGAEELSIGVEDWSEVPSFELSPANQLEVVASALVGERGTLKSNPVDFRRIAFLASAHYVRLLSTEQEGSANIDRGELFRQSLRTISRASSRGILVTQSGHVYDEATLEDTENLVNWLEEATQTGERARARDVQALLDDNVSWRFTVPFEEYETRRKDVCETLKSEISHAVCDSGWEVQVAQALDRRDDVIGWVRNERLGWQIPWLDPSTNAWRRYHPDFVVRIDRENGGILNVVIEVKGREDKDDLVKKRYAEEYWIPSVNKHSELRRHGKWTYIYVTNPSSIHRMINEAKERDS